MSIIRAPFNFVPLSDKVVFPAWADKISQDIPFKDGISGTIGLIITAETPIFIRNGHAKADEPGKDGKFNGKTEDEKQLHERRYNSFSCIMDNNGYPIKDKNGMPLYFIPATSIKGEVRSILEIMSFSKMTVDKRAKFALRDLNDKKFYTLLDHQEDILCGWLHRNADYSGYTISDCSRPMRISQPAIDDYLQSHILESHFAKDCHPEKLQDNEKTASYKYGLIGDTPLEGLHFSSTDVERRDKAITVVYDPYGSIKGTIVFTGQSDTWKREPVMGRGKYYEFVFGESEGTHKLSNDQFNFYSFIYEDTEDWKRAMKLLDDQTENGVPVFFRLDSNGNIKDFGLAYLYKLPFTNSVWDSLPKKHHSQKADLAQCIFGYTDSEEIKGFDGKNESSMGRVHFGNAFVKQGSVVHPLELKKLPLGSPKASYLPIYVKQTDGHDGQLNVSWYDKKNKPHYTYKTYDNSTPNGWKRYYERKETWGKPAELNAKYKDTQNTQFIPLDKDVEFYCPISFHNLRPVELGGFAMRIGVRRHSRMSTSAWAS